MTSFKSTWLVFLSLGVCGLVQAQVEVCRLTVSSMQRNPFQATSRELVQEFPLVLDDSKLSKEVLHQASGVLISMGVEVLLVVDKPKVIRLAISFGPDVNSVFEALDGVEARTFYDKNWRALSVSKNIEKPNRIYTFEFSCERVKKKKR